MMGLNSTSSTSSSNSLDDDELTNLTWLQNNNLLKNMTQDSVTTSGDFITKGLKEDNENVSPMKVRHDVKVTDLKANLLTSSLSSTAICSVPPVRYNPLLHTHTKPPYSFSSLICMAIESSPTKALPVKDIYSWIAKNFPFYQDAPDGWKNTVRHNLSLNKCFQKIEKGKKLKDASFEEKKLLNEQLASKGSLWCIDQHSRPNLLQSIKKTPAHIYPYMSTAKTGTNLIQIKNVINRTNDNQPTNKIGMNNIQSTVTVDNNISPSNDQSPNKMIAIDKLPQKNILTAAKRVLIPITKVAGRREPEEADAAESMLTLTQCSTASSLGQTYYIITNKNDNFLPIQLNKSPATSTAVKQQSPIKNQITFLTQPIIQASSIRPTATIAIKPVVTLAKDKNATTLTSASTTKFSTSTDHNYSTQRTVNNVITLPITSLPIASLAGQKLILTSASKPTISNFVPMINKNANRLITIAPAKTLTPKVTITSTTPKVTPTTAAIIIKSPLKQSATETISTKKPIKKQKVEVVNDEDGLKCAEALFNLANGSTVKLSKASGAEKKSADNKNQSVSKKQADTPTVTLTRSAAKKLKTTA